MLEGNEGFTASHIAVYMDYIDMTNILLQHGADVNAVNREYGSALHIAAHDGHVDIAKVLIQNGADVNAVEKGICQPFGSGFCSTPLI